MQQRIKKKTIKKYHFEGNIKRRQPFESVHARLRTQRVWYRDSARAGPYLKQWEIFYKLREHNDQCSFGSGT